MRRILAASCLLLGLGSPLLAQTRVRVQNDTLRAWTCEVEGAAGSVREPAGALEPAARTTLLLLDRAAGEVRAVLRSQGVADLVLRLRGGRGASWALGEGAALARERAASTLPVEGGPADLGGEGGVQALLQTRTERGREVLELHLWESLPRPAPTGPDELSVLAWNLWLRPTTLFGNGQRERVGHIAGVVAGHDVLVLSEAFDDGEREELLRRLAPEFPHTTRIVGEDKFLAQDGGVIIVSRWPIEREEQEVFRDHSGADSHADKGVGYARIRKQGRAWHVLGTHLQAGGEAEEDKVAVRAKQLAQLRAFLERLALPADEPVLVAGDLNVDLRPAADGSTGPEMTAALGLLQASRLELRGPLAFTYDATLNPLAEDVREHLDHVLVSRTHAALAGEVAVRPYRSRSPLAFREDPCRDLSDHFAVTARVRLVTPLPPPPEAPCARGYARALGE